MTADRNVAERLEQLRAALRAENISYGELAELQGLAAHIDPGDVELLEAAGVPEFPEESEPEPEIKIAVTDMDGTLIDVIECTKDDLRNEVQRNPHSLLSGINVQLID